VPIGTLQSVFSQRNGTPRQARPTDARYLRAACRRDKPKTHAHALNLHPPAQPLLAPSARSRLVLAPHVPAAALEGLEEFSHVWVLYVFHANTNLGERLGEAARASSALAKVHVRAPLSEPAPLRGAFIFMRRDTERAARAQVPRLNGARRGVLATRSPHRPTPLGLSVGRVRAVRGRVLELAGLDVVDGSPVLDIKPFLPFCDAPADATAPDWAQARPARAAALFPHHGTDSHVRAAPS
jgi:tRNA (Thr-GGU) A37 N-methylase